MNKILRFALGTDHAGYNFKEAIKDHLHNLGHETKDFGTFQKIPSTTLNLFYSSKSCSRFTS